MVGVPVGGAAPSGMFTVAVWPAFVWPMVFVAAIGLPDVGLIATVTLTLDSSLSPWLVNLTVKVGLVDHGTRLTTPGASGCSVTSPTLVLIEAVAVQAGRRLAGRAGRAAGSRCGRRCEATWPAPSHEMSRQEAAAGDLLARRCRSSSSASLMSGATRWE